MTMLYFPYQLIILLLGVFHVQVQARAIDPWTQNVHDLINRIESFRDETLRREHELNQAKFIFEQEKNQVRAQVNADDVVRLNVGGQLISTRRETLLKVPNSLLHSIFDGRYEHALQRDRDGSYFLDYNPELFQHLLDQLRGLQPNGQPILRPPPSLGSAKSFDEMLSALKLPVAPRQGSDLVVLNVGGEKIATLRQTLVALPGSKLARLVSSDEALPRDRFGRVFLNYNPRLFRLLLNELRHGTKLTEIKTDETLAGADRTAFEKMLAELQEIKRTTATTKVPSTTVKKTTKKPDPKKQKPKKTM